MKINFDYIVEGIDKKIEALANARATAKMLEAVGAACLADMGMFASNQDGNIIISTAWTHGNMDMATVKKIRNKVSKLLGSRSWKLEHVWSSLGHMIVSYKWKNHPSLEVWFTMSPENFPVKEITGKDSCRLEMTLDEEERYQIVCDIGGE